MWLMLALAVVVCVAVLYVPGYLFARSLSVARFASVAIAPMISIFFLAVLGIVLFEVGVTCSGPVLLAIAVAIGAIALLVSKGIAQAKAPNASRELIAIDDVKGAWKAAALYVAVAFAVVFVVFLLAIDGPESFSRNDDTTVHLAIVRGFLDTGTFSTLHASSYLDQGVTSSFYPSAWHVVTAVVASFFGNAVTLAANASIIALTAVVFPLGMCLLFLKLFGEGKRVVWAGSLFVVAFCGFPWGFVVYGQLLSNMVSFMLIPLAFVALVGAIEAKGLSGKVRLAFLVAAGLVSIALSQPNGAFTFGIWAVLYCMGRILVPPCDDAPRIASKRIAAAAALFAVACGLGRAVFRTVLAERGSVHVESHAFTSRGDRRRLAVHVHDARGRAAFLERRGAGGRHLHVQEQAVLVDDGRLRVRLRRVRYRRVDRRRGEAGAVGVLVHRLLPNGRDDGAFRHPACFLGFRPTGRYRQVVVREGSARAGGSSEVQVPAGGHPRRADAHVPVLPLSCEADG